MYPYSLTTSKCTPILWPTWNKASLFTDKNDIHSIFLTICLKGNPFHWKAENNPFYWPNGYNMPIIHWPTVENYQWPTRNLIKVSLLLKDWELRRQVKKSTFNFSKYQLYIDNSDRYIYNLPGQYGSYLSYSGWLSAPTFTETDTTHGRTSIYIWIPTSSGA